MTKFKRFILTFCLATVTVLASGCGAVTAVPSPTGTPVPSLNPTETLTAVPSPTNTPEPIFPSGTIFYSDFRNLYSVDLQSQQSRVVLQLSDGSSYRIVNNFIYETLFSTQSNQWEIFRMNLDGTVQKQMTTSGAITIFNVDPTNHYLPYNDSQAGLALLDLSNNKTQTIAEPDENQRGSEWFFAISWSSNGKKLIYKRVLKPEVLDECRLFVYDIITNRSTELLPKCNAAWSPDGKKIAIIGRVDIWDTETNLIVKQIPVIADELAWSPDGKSFVFSYDDTAYFYNGENGSIEVIATYPDIVNSFISSPDRTMTLYEQRNRTTETGLYLFNMKEKAAKKIYSQRSILTGQSRTDWFYSSVWSPDGKYFAYFTTTEPNNDSKTNPRAVFLNVYSVETGGAVSFEVPAGGYMVFGTQWLYPQ